MKSILKLSLFILLFGFSLNSSAIEIDKVISASMSSLSVKLTNQAMIWLVVFSGLQFLITNLGLLKSGADIEAIFGKLMGSLLWIGFCFYLLANGPSFIDAVGNQFISLLGVTLPSKFSIFVATYTPGISLLGGAVVVGGMGAIGSVVGGQILTMLAFAMMGMGTYLIIKLFMIKLELLIVVTLSPLSFAFLGLNALKDQGIAPLKSLISLGYRIILTTIIIGAFSQLSVVMSDVILSGVDKIKSVSNLLDAINPLATSYGVGNLIADITTVLFGYVVLTYLLFKSDSIAASLAGGSTNMGGGDVASAAAAGAAMGAAGASASAPLAEKGKSMADVIKGFGANAGSLSNASPTGAGGLEQKMVGTAPPPSPKAAELSMAQVSADRMERRPGSGGANSSDVGKPSNPSQPTQAVSKPLETSSPNSTTSGSGESAGIVGSASATDQKLDKLIDSMSAPSNSKSGFLDKLSTANDHIAKEQAATHVSISTHHSD